MQHNRIQTTFRIDPELLETFRHALLERKTKMTPVIEKLIREWLHGYEYAPKHQVVSEQPQASTVLAKTPGLSEAENIPISAEASHPGVPTATLPPPKPTADPWSRILDVVRKKTTGQYFDTWLKPTKYSHSSRDTLFVRVPSAEFKEIGDDFADLILEAMDNLGLDYQDVKFVISDMASTQVKSASAPATEKDIIEWDDTEQLNARYTFNAFVVGSGNQFAHAACQAVAERPSKAYNPLFLYGGVGMGKTHLMHAIGHEIKRRQPDLTVRYLTSEKFTNELINSLRYDKIIRFRNAFRTVDVLLVDDIQFLAQKERTQEEFFHTFNALYESMKQIVIASDRPPKELAEIEDRLRSRFEWGLIADIQPPDLETKVAILQKKAEEEKITLPTDVALYIASKVRFSIRELESALSRLVAYSSLIGTSITLPNAQQVLTNLIDSRAPTVTIEAIQKLVAKQFGLRLVEIKAKNNSLAIVYPRQIAMYLAKHLTEASLPEIGSEFGRKHATTVLHSVKKIDELRKIDKDLNRLLNKLTVHLGG